MLQDRSRSGDGENSTRMKCVFVLETGMEILAEE